MSMPCSIISPDTERRTGINGLSRDLNQAKVIVWRISRIASTRFAMR